MAMGSTQSFALMSFLSPVPSPSEALTCDSMGDVGNRHRLRLCLDARVWILHLHHECFDLQSTARRGWLTGVDRREPQHQSSPGEHPRGVSHRNGCHGHSPPQTSPCHWRCHCQTTSAFTLPHNITLSYRRRMHSQGQQMRGRM